MVRAVHHYLQVDAELGVPGSFCQQFGQAVRTLISAGSFRNSVLLGSAEGLFCIWAICMALAEMKTIRHVAAC